MSNNADYKLLTCFHCGNTGNLNIEHLHKHTFGGPIYDENNVVIDYDPLEKYRWILVSCPVCHRVSLFEECDDDLYNETFSKYLYPKVNMNLSAVPHNIKTAYEAALKVKNIDSAICLLSLRRVLEAICKDKNAVGNTLEQMIENLIESNAVPKMFEDAFWIIRNLGNSAAHADDRVFYSGQVEIVLRYMTTIIEYLYVLPESIKTTREALERENAAHKKIHSKDNGMPIENI